MDRQDYMTGKVSHEEYYGYIAELAGISFSNSKEFIEKRIVPALEAGDEHLNTIALRNWDIMAANASPAIKRALKQVEGEFYSMAIGVCVMKAAAKIAAKKIGGV
jgi:hypothetical protein